MTQSMSTLMPMSRPPPPRTLLILGSGERCKPFSGVWGGAPEAKHILREIEVKTSIYNYHNIMSARFSNKDFIRQKLENCMQLLATPLKCCGDPPGGHDPQVENPWSNGSYFFAPLLRYSVGLLLSVPFRCICIGVRYWPLE